jgi:predicted GNAT superfamily acetyltransferase
MPGPEITIRHAGSPADYRAIQHAQRLAWGLTDDSYVVPIATMVGAQHHGGLVLGAFLPNGEAVGLSFAFLGRTGDRWCLYSQLTGVVPGYQGQGLGAQIKQRQREHARSIGVSIIAWAFDPLQAGNAHFNLGRLGATARRYIEDMYGPRTDDLNRGVPTDRLIAEWPVDPASARPREDREVLGSPRLVEGPDEPVSAPWARLAGTTPLLVEIPAEIARLRRDDPDRAERWRAAVENGRSFYVLRRK